MTDTQLLDLLESGEVALSDLSKLWDGWHYWLPGWRRGKSLRDCIRKLAELKEKK